MKKWLSYLLLLFTLSLPVWGQGQGTPGLKPDVWIYAVPDMCSTEWYNEVIANFLELGVVAKRLPGFDKVQQGSSVLMVFASPAFSYPCKDRGSEFMTALGSGLLGALRMAEDKGSRVLFVMQGEADDPVLSELSDVLIGKFGFMLRYTKTREIFGNKSHLSGKYFLPGLKGSIIGPIREPLWGSLWPMVFPPNRRLGRMRPLSTVTTGKGEKFTLSAIDDTGNLLIMTLPELKENGRTDIFYQMHEDDNKAVVQKLLNWLQTGEPLW